MLEDSENISRKTWSRNVESVNKIGYMDGAADGQTAVFQTSFDMGYKQGFKFGIELGSNNAIRSLQQQEDSPNNYLNNIRDTRKINCQLCLNGIPSEQNVVNLYNTQQEQNNEVTKQRQSM